MALQEEKRIIHRPKLSPAMIRAARGFLDWQRSDLARESGVSLAAIYRVETTGRMRAVTEAALIQTFQSAGIFMIHPDSAGGAGIRQIKIS